MSEFPVNLTKHWIVKASLAKQLIEQGATFLDAREPKLKGWGTLENAIPVTWEEFSQQHPPNQGKLLEEDRLLTEKLQELGIWENVPVVVFADPSKGWGEEGRIVWMLRTLGHSQAVWVDGGYQALIKAGVPATKKASKALQKGDFIVSRTSQWDIQRDELKTLLETDNLAIIDAREPREYAGKTPYGEQRGGHVPGAVPLYYKALMDSEGRLLSQEQISTILHEKGIESPSQIINYCTGGVRSGWLTSVLVNLGFSAKNYAGSMWEWSAGPGDNYPLEKQS